MVMSSLYGHRMARMAMHQETANKAMGILAAALFGHSATAQTLARLSATITANLMLTAYSCTEEKEADLYATHIAYNPGYNPTFLNSMFLRMYQASPKQPIKFFSKHPPIPDRIHYVTMCVDAFPLAKEWKIDTAEFRAIKQRLGAKSPARKGKTSAPVLRP